jgi:hypothetical protein
VVASPHEFPPAPGADPTVPSAARSYDYLLGGKDNVEVDRQAVRMLLSVAPDAPLTARANRAFGTRAMRFIAEQGIRQFIDLGSGIPTTRPAVHEVVRAVVPDARVVYVDFDPLVVAHSNALRTIHPGLSTVLGDIRAPQALLDHPDLRAQINFAEPVGVGIFSVLDEVEDRHDPYGIVARLRGRMAPGSYLGISHLSARSDADAVARCRVISEQTGCPRVEFRSDEDVLRLFDGFDLVEPGLVTIRQWRPAEPEPDTKLRLVGAIGRRV